MNRFQWRERLCPLTVLAPVPVLPGTVGRTDDTRRVPAGYSDRDAARQTVREMSYGLVTVRAGDSAVVAQATVEEKGMTERRGTRIVGDGIARVRRQRGQRVQRQCPDDRELVFGECPRRCEPLPGVENEQRDECQGNDSGESDRPHVRCRRRS